MKIGVFVGSFNPVHIGHMSIVNGLLNKKHLDKIIVVATNDYWDKTGLVDLKHRINMLKTYESDKVIIDTKNNTCGYTIEVLNNLKKEYKDDSISLIIGADQLPKFHLWYKINDILNYEIIVINRNGIDTKEYIDKFDKKDNFIVVNDIKEMNISSTDIRNGNTKYLDKAVYEYILENNLYELGVVH